MYKYHILIRRGIELAYPILYIYLMPQHINVLNKYGLGLDSRNGQGYNKRTNMKGKNLENQRRILDQNYLFK